jgi:hypothetical protein
LESEFRWFVGIDWGGESHQVCVLDRDRRKIEERSVKHDGEGVGELIRWVGSMVGGERATMAAALEVPHGPIVEALLACGISVFALLGEAAAALEAAWSGMAPLGALYLMFVAPFVSAIMAWKLVR